MTVQELSLKCGLKVFSMPMPEEEVSGGYCGDLLSWVMGRLESGSAWITIMSNINILAVASLAGASCIILAEDVIPDRDLIKTAEEKGIDILGSGKSAYDIALLLSDAIG